MIDKIWKGIKENCLREVVYDDEQKSDCGQKNKMKCTAETRPVLKSFVELIDKRIEELRVRVNEKEVRE